MAKISPTDITLEALKAGQFRTEFPKFYEQKNFTENNVAHDQQNVYDHAIAVLESLEELLRLEFVKQADAREKIEQYLQTVPEKQTRQTLIFLATVFHDLGKMHTVVEVSPGVFSCPSHELISLGLAKEYWPQLDLTPAEQTWLENFISQHGYMHGFLDAYLKGQSKKALVDALQQSLGDLTLGLLLFVYADLKGSDLQKLNPASFTQRVAAVEQLIDQVVI
jgi:hypothetical protein